MNETTPSDAVEPTPQDLVTRAAVFGVLADAAKQAATEARQAATPAWAAARNDPKNPTSDHLDVVVPGLGRVVTAVLNAPSATAAVTDQEAFVDGQRRSSPNHVTWTARIEVTAGFDDDAIVAEVERFIGDVLAERFHPSRVVFRPEGWRVNDTWQRGLLEQAASQGEPVDKNGVEIAGVTVKPAGDPTKFTLPAAKWAPGAKQALLEMLSRGGTAAVLDSGARELDPARVVQSEVVEESADT